MGLMKITHFSHGKHFLTLKDPQQPYQCNGCKEMGFGLCYECEHGECNFYLHDACANSSPSAYHRFFRRCKYFKFHAKAPQEGERYCDACGKDVLGFVYQSADKYPHDLHPCCLKLPDSLTLDPDNDGVTVVLKKELPSMCLKCGTKEIWKKFTGWGYVSNCGKYCYHVACVNEICWEGWKRKLSNKTETICLERSLQSFNQNQQIARLNGRPSSKAKKLWKIAKTVIMFSISAIFGDPTSLVLGVAQLLRDN